MSTIFDFPPELIERILVEAQPLDVSSFAQTCRIFRSIVYEAPDQHIWRSLFIASFDDPRTCLTPSGGPTTHAEHFDWKGELQRRTRARAVLDIGRTPRPGETGMIIKTLVSMADNIPPATTSYAYSEVSKNLVWLGARLKQGQFLDRWSPPGLPEDEHQLLAKLHTYFGLTPNDLTKSQRAASRACVYDMRKYTAETQWGPFLPDAGGRVNWRQLQAIQHVMSVHVLRFDAAGPSLEPRLSPLSLPFCQAQRQKGRPLDTAGDWAGVAGAWQCSFCFCDHRDLITFNEPNIPANVPRDHSMFEDDDFEEVHRAMHVRVNVTHTVPDRDHPTRPIIFFKGSVRHVHTMSGEVFMTPDDQIRWRFRSGEDGREVWSSEGVQIGSVQSAFGVLGIWSTVFHDENDPVGPFHLRKLPGGYDWDSEDEDD